ncbi:MAG: TIGR00341 family protein [Bacteroidales bacterium]
MSVKNIILRWIDQRFNLDEEKDKAEEVIQSIERSIYFKGTNLWVLIFAILIASIGLNVNSTAVIIGAMLISPLMGPIMGVGLGIGINDLVLLRKSIYNFTLAVVISLVTSSLYFAVSPLNEAHSELLSRTTPTTWDVFIAFFGGLAGIIGVSSKNKGNVIPGVAIATALMPPLCTAGYAIAAGNFYFFMGAFYLFFINSLFICVATFLIVRFLKYPVHQYADRNKARKVRKWVFIITVITFIPSVFLAYQIVLKSSFETNAEKFITHELSLKDHAVISKNINSGNKSIEIVLLGEKMDEEMIDRIKQKLPEYNLKNAVLEIKQESGTLSTRDLSKIKSQLLEDLYAKNMDILATKDDKIRLLENEINNYKSLDIDNSLIKEVGVIFPSIRESSISKAILSDQVSNKQDTVYLVYCKFKNLPAQAEKEKLESWLKLRLKEYKVKLLIY